jgi:hypothetical protein
MIRDFAIIRESARHLAEAANATVDTLLDGRIEQEPAFTDRMLGRIEQAMEGFSVKGVRWTAKTLTDRAPHAQEKRFGADFVGVLNIDLPAYAVNKGFLAQAKMIEPHQPIWAREYSHMHDQCAQMLSLTPDSFVFLYSKQGITVVPAISIVSAVEGVNPHSLYSRDIARFFEEHFECFIGDRRINAPNIDALEKIRAEMEAQRLLYLSARLG